MESSNTSFVSYRYSWFNYTVVGVLFIITFPLQIHSQIINSIGMKLVEIPVGNFYMGYDYQIENENFDESPGHQVFLTQPFKMGVTEVTNAQYENFDPEHRNLRGKFGLSKDDDEAVIFVSYYDAVEFCKWLSAKEGRSYRLPTEAEWEYACKAGSYTSYYNDDVLSNVYRKRQEHVWGDISSGINLKVATTPPNCLGLYDMHGNVEEWCYDWYGAYDHTTVLDPTGPEKGIFKVTRGGSHSTPVKYLRSNNRMGMLPEDKHWLTGFRVVCDAKTILEESEVLDFERLDENISQEKYNWEPTKSPMFLSPIPYVVPPQHDSRVPFYMHNHCPAITWCDNGDLLAVWFSTDDEAGREMVILSSRLKAGQSKWEQPKLFFKVPDRNMTGSSLFNDGQGRLIFINSIAPAGTWTKLIMVMRTSFDNGETWSRPRIISSEYGFRNQTIAGMLRTKEGWLLQPADATPWGSGGTALLISKDNGESWSDSGRNVACNFVEGGKGGSIAGIHAAVVELENGSLLAFGRGNDIKNSEGRWCMPKSISYDKGMTWHYSSSEFPPIDSGQRLTMLKLKEGPLLLISFTHHPFRYKNNVKGMSFGCVNGKEYVGYGMFAALSFDDGKTWPVKKLLTDGTDRYLNGGAWTGIFKIDKTHAEPRGYLAATQSPDGTIHLLSSMNYYRFNLSWLLTNQ